MPKVTLEFNLPEDTAHYNWANSGYRYWRMLTDIEQCIRNKVKHATLSEEQTKVWYEIQEMFYSIVQGSLDQEC